MAEQTLFLESWVSHRVEHHFVEIVEHAYVVIVDHPYYYKGLFPTNCVNTNLHLKLNLN